jgi:hypothetical protein
VTGFECEEVFAAMDDRNLLIAAQRLMAEMTKRGFLSQSDTERLLAESPEAQRIQAEFESKVPADLRASGARDA